MARVLALIPDLLFGSRVQAELQAAGHTVALVGDAAATRDALAGANVLVVDLTAELEASTSLVESLAAQSLLDGVRTLGFYSHVDAQARRLAQVAGFDLVVPRSRMAREGPALVEGLIEDR